ncbi:MAG: reverse transcriptase family protein, partial [Nitrososphaeraceae archaeon]|nr:reverse transcriptase family protein [Nitrososphaeraceae archaeon]
INAQSLPAHYSEFINIFDNLPIHACLISETWLKPSLPSTLYPLPGFSLLRNDRKLGRGGGVAIFLRNDLPYKIVSQSPTDRLSIMEYIFVEVSFHGTKVLLGVVYSPPGVSYHSHLEDLVYNYLPSYPHSIIMGDFNTDLYKCNSRASSLWDIVNSGNLTILPSFATHHIDNCYSLLDLAITSSPERILFYSQLPAPGFSHHDLLLLSYRLRSPKACPKTFLSRNFRRIDPTSLLEDANSYDWLAISDLSTVDEKVHVFNEYVIKLYDKHAPLTRTRIKRKAAPWLNDIIRNLMAMRDRAKARYKANPVLEHWETFRVLRNRCTQMCRNAKKHYISTSIEQCTPTNIWRFLSTIGIGKTREESGCQFDANLLNSFFAKSPTVFDPVTKLDALNSIIPSMADLKQFTIADTSEAEVKSNLLAIKSKSSGSDGISIDALKPIIDVIVPTITDILNTSLATAIFPSEWKKAYIIPLPKIACPTQPKDFRPISILPLLSKVFERIIHSQLVTFLNSHQLLDPFQSGFRSGHSTSTALVKVTDDIRLAMNNTQITILVLLDFSNAFNSVDFDILLARLKSINVSQPSLDWFKSYLQGRRQCVKTSDTCSEWTDLVTGVPQGGVLSPLLFSLFIDSVVKTLRSNYHLYADDLQIYLHSDPDAISTAIDDINADLYLISQWAQKMGLLINPSKSQAIIIGSQRLVSKINMVNLPQLTLNGTAIPFSSTVKDLGLLIDQNLSWQPQVNDVGRRIFSRIHSLKRLQKFIPTKTKVHLCQTLLLPLLDYGDVCYLNLTEDRLNKLNCLQNVCIRYIFGLRKYDHISEFRSRLNWVEIRDRRNIHALSLLFNVLNNPNSPSYLSSRFTVLSAHGRGLRSESLLTLLIPKHNTSFYEHSFTVHAAKLWNQLDPDIQNAPSIQTFKSRLTKQYLS